MKVEESSPAAPLLRVAAEAVLRHYLREAITTFEVTPHAVTVLT